MEHTADCAAAVREAFHQGLEQGRREGSVVPRVSTDSDTTQDES